MWYPTITDTEQKKPPGSAGMDHLDEQIPPIDELEKGDTTVSPGTEYWLP
jgi:hypothetical protein